MDARLLDYYNRELTYLRELGAEFAQEYPKIAGRLGMHNTEIADPYVERLLEGFSFLTARIQLKMDAEFPRFSQRLLEVVYPNYLAPTPSMAVLGFQPNLREGSLAEGYTLPAGTPLRANLAQGQQTPCEFRTAHEVVLWPLRLTEVSMGGEPADLPLARLGLAGWVRGSLRLRLEVVGAGQLAELPIERLNFFLSGQENQALQLLELMMGHCQGVICRDPKRPEHCMKLDETELRHEGFAASDALLPYGTRGFQGYRLLHEYFAFPARFLFFSMGSLRQAMRQLDGKAFEIIFLFERGDAELERSVDRRSLSLFCTPAINLFAKRSDRMAVSTQNYEHHLLIDRAKPLDYEVYSIEKIVGHRAEGGQEYVFQPFYGSPAGAAREGASYFSTRREPRLVPGQARRNSSRTGYIGSEVFLSLVDRREAPFAEDLRYISADTLCTNRDLPMLMPLDGKSDFSLRLSAPVEAVKILRGPTPPHLAIAENEITWRLISHLGLNYLTLTDLEGPQGAQALRELLELYAGIAEPGLKKQVQSIRSARLEPVYRQLPQPGPIVYGRGVRITLTLDEAAFPGAGIYLFGSVLEQFFARHVSLNSFSELAITTLQRGEVRRWEPRIGRRPVA